MNQRSITTTTGGHGGPSGGSCAVARGLARGIARGPGRVLAVSLVLLIGSGTVGLTGCQTTGGSAAEPTNKVARLLEQGESLIAEGRLEAALAAFGLALEENPRVVEAHMGMGNVYQQLGDYRKAAASFERATQIDPTSVDALYSMGLMHQLMGKGRSAVNAYLRALTVDPYRFEANRDLAAVYLQMGRAGDALPYAQQAVRVRGDDRAAWANLAACYSRLGQWEQSVEAFEQTVLLTQPAGSGEIGVLIGALEQDEIPEAVLLGLANAYIQVGRLDDAQDTLRGLLVRRESAVVYERLAYVLFRQRRIEEALENFRNAVAMDPEDTASLNGVGATLMAIYLRDERRDRNLRREAIAAWRQSLRIKRDQPQIADLVSRYIDR